MRLGSPHMKKKRGKIKALLFLNFFARDTGVWERGYECPYEGVCTVVTCLSASVAHPRHLGGCVQWRGEGGCDPRGPRKYQILPGGR